VRNGDYQGSAPPSRIHLARIRFEVRPMTPHCLLLLLTLCQGLMDRPVRNLAFVQTAFAASDTVTSRELRGPAFPETDPVMRRLFGRDPSAADFSLTFGAQTLGGMYLAEKMRQSPHRWIRKIWWVPQVVTIQANARGTASNVYWLHRRPGR
jgi:hypothetical protein